MLTGINYKRLFRRITEADYWRADLYRFSLYERVERARIKGEFSNTFLILHE